MSGSGTVSVRFCDPIQIAKNAQRSSSVPEFIKRRPFKNQKLRLITRLWLSAVLNILSGNGSAILRPQTTSLCTSFALF